MSARFYLKEGVQLCLLDPRVEKAIPTICAVWKRLTGVPPTITSARDGTHSPNSLHYEGRALDFRTHGLNRSQLLELRAELKEALGPDWDVVIESTHLHLELDRRADV